MTEHDPDVKSDSGQPHVRIVVLWTNCKHWMTARPLLGWYLAAIGTLNVVLQFLQILGR